MTAVTATGYGDQKLLMGPWHHKMRARGCAFAHGEGSDDVAAVAQLRGSTATSVMATMEPLAPSVGGGVPGVYARIPTATCEQLIVGPRSTRHSSR